MRVFVRRFGLHWLDFRQDLGKCNVSSRIFLQLTIARLQNLQIDSRRERFPGIFMGCHRDRRWASWLDSCDGLWPKQVRRVLVLEKSKFPAFSHW
ncbi:MAG: hypothetical protein HC767_05960 [Akkermansiaceae bacterium]|nr:hypothetical protein [Akkermansiaceae bacterium]